jgi:hypothetical protein
MLPIGQPRLYFFFVVLRYCLWGGMCSMDGRRRMSGDAMTGRELLHEADGIDTLHAKPPVI